MSDSPATIFDDAAYDGYGTVAHQRRCGLLYLNGIKPETVDKGATVEHTGPDTVRVHYLAAYMPEGAPEGVTCDHPGGYEDRHQVKQLRHFDASLAEVLA